MLILNQFKILIKYMKNKVIIVLLILVFVSLGGGFWVIKNKEGNNKGASQEEVGNNIIKDQQQNQEEEQGFVVDVDMNADNWQTKETEFFTIKFPKEWYWLESDREKTGYYSHVITNNPKFDMVKNADIGVFSGIGPRSPLELSNNTEVVITNRGVATSDAGTPQDSIDAIFRLAKHNFSSVDCNISNNKSIPFTAHCSALYDSQLQQSYYVINDKISLTLTARTIKGTLVKKEILDKIVGSIILK